MGLIVILPFTKYLFLQLATAIIGLNLIRDKELKINGILKSWIVGQMLLFAVLHTIAVPMILLRCRFMLLFWCFLVAAFVLFSLGCWKLKKTKIVIRKPELSPFSLSFFVVTVLLILWQAAKYLFGVHLDEDDARWLVQANDALEYGDMFIRSYYTGEYLGHLFLIKDATSPWPMVYAIFAQLLGTRAAVFAHTIYPPIELILVYIIYWLLGSELFRKTESRIVFLFFVTIVNLWFCGNDYTQADFTLVRIWQGKASVAAIIIPVLLYLFISINKWNRLADWFCVLVSASAACLMSGMGIVIGAIIICIYGVYNILSYRNWKRIPCFFVDLLPSTITTLIYLKLME